MELLRRLRNWKPDPEYLRDLQEGIEPPKDAMQQLWDLCDVVVRLRMSVATALAGVGSALLAIALAAILQLVADAECRNLPAWRWSVSLLIAAAILLAGVWSWVIAHDMVSIASRIGPYYQDEVRDRWLRKEE